MSIFTAYKNPVEDLLVRDKQVELVAATMPVIYRAGESGEAVYFARGGMVKLSEDHGPAGLTLEVVSPGELFGEELLLGERTYRAKAIRMAKGEILRIPVAVFQRVAGRYPELWRAVATHLHHKLRREQTSFRQLVNVTTEARIVAALEYLAPRCPLAPGEGERHWHDVPLTQAELAVMVGASRETTSSVLNALERRGALELRRGRILMPQAMSRTTHAG